MEDDTSHGNPLDIKCSDFDCDAYLSHLLKKKTLDELVQVEEDMVHNVRRLDSEMQQLVYENYNKFLTATSTVKKMQKDFLEIGREMESLSKRMNRISDLSKDLCSAFGKHRADVAHLADANRTVKSLQFMLSLPQKLQSLLEQKEYGEAVKCYLAARQSLLRYSHVPSVASISDDSKLLMADVEKQLRSVVCNRYVSSEDLTEAVSLLLRLDVPASSIHTDFLESCGRNLSDQIDALQKRDEKDSQGVAEDVLEFVDDSCSSFLADLSLFTALNQRLFPAQAADGDVIEMLDGLMARFEDVVRARFLRETDARECAIVVRALDRFYRRISSCNQLVPGVDYSPISISMLNAVSRHEIILARERVVDRVRAGIHQVRSELATLTCAPRSSSTDLSEMVSRLEHILLVQLKTALASLLLFTASDMTFSSLDPSLFTHGFGVDVHESLVVNALEEVSTLGRSFCEYNTHTANVNPTLIILLAQFYINIEARSVSYIFDLCQEQFRLVTEREKGDKSQLTSLDKLRISLRSTAHALLKHYVRIQGVIISQLLVKSVEARDWLVCAEPTAVRAVIKRLIEDLSSLDSLIKPFVDCYYLQQNLWHYVSDEQVTVSLLDEIISSAVHRSLDPKLMDPNTVKAICERQ
ncbi:Vacuolar protein sorting-associated protein 51 -like protein [Toxocara canis]|uniref:Vacuolar protein sorting-associated protein 51 homolog n=1 Tax=Toxocara canis TaxID=6265 RepID=A0A0B2VS48_TOXCA|nr:Vacuolar protein sorting-associated protein 51 -like protein [Toxocara canis]